MSKSQKKVAWANLWNMIITTLFYETLLTETEMEIYRYDIIGNVDGDHLSGEVRDKDWKSIKKPRNKKAEERLIFFINSLLSIPSYYYF